jgi:hypothetical protein
MCVDLWAGKPRHPLTVETRPVIPVIPGILGQ